MLQYDDDGDDVRMDRKALSMSCFRWPEVRRPMRGNAKLDSVFGPSSIVSLFEGRGVFTDCTETKWCDL